MTGHTMLYHFERAQHLLHEKNGVKAVKARTDERCLRIKLFLSIKSASCYLSFADRQILT